jgi:CheY-like chemotaxis protein
MKALVVDDRKEIAELIRDMFFANNVQADIATTHDDALAYQDRLYDIIFVDKLLDNGNTGEKLIRIFQHNHPCEAVLFSGQTISDADKINCKVKSYDCIKDEVSASIQRAKHREDNPMSNSDNNADAMESRIMRNVCTRQKEDCFKQIDRVYLSKNEFLDYINKESEKSEVRSDEHRKEAREHRRWLIGILASLIVASGAVIASHVSAQRENQKNIDQIGFVGKDLTLGFNDFKAEILSLRTDFSNVKADISYLKAKQEDREKPQK